MAALLHGAQHRQAAAFRGARKHNEGEGGSSEDHESDANQTDITPDQTPSAPEPADARLREQGFSTDSLGRLDGGQWRTIAMLLRELKPFIPSGPNFAKAKAFFQDLGFEVDWEVEGGVSCLLEVRHSIAGFQ